MNLGRYMRQTVTIQRRTGYNDAQEPIYSAPFSVPALFQPNDGLVRTITGQETRADSTLLTVDRIELGDLISGTVTQADGTEYEIGQDEVRGVTPIVYKGRAIGFNSRL